MFTAGVRFNSQVYVTFDLDVDNGTMTAAVTIIDSEDIEHVITGEVVWDE